MRTVYNWAISEDLVQISPCYGLKRFAKEKSRERVLDTNEIRQVHDALRHERPLIAAYFRLLFLTACRGSEALNAQWNEIDFERRLWTISLTKAGRSHALPLSSRAIEVLQTLRLLRDGSVHIFPSPTGSGPITYPGKTVARVRDRSGLEYRIHDIRRTVSTGLVLGY